jgi:hypothetical protein
MSEIHTSSEGVSEPIFHRHVEVCKEGQGGIEVLADWKSE